MKICSSTWEDDVAAGEMYPLAMRRCPACLHSQPPIYFASDGICFDCATDGPIAPKGEVIVVSPIRTAPAWAAFKVVAESEPAAYSRALASLTARERAAVEGVVAGISARAVARDTGVSAPVICLALGRAVNHFKQLGLIGANTLNSIGNIS